MPTPRYLLIGGSNCVIKDGFGAKLQEALPGRWVNRSLGNSPSLRGAEYLLGHSSEWADFDQIFFEYTLNDLIFETVQTLDPQAHLDWLSAMLGAELLRRKLVFVLLNGNGASRRVGSNYSFVLDHYRRLIRDRAVRTIDLQPLIADEVAQNGADTVFKDNDHFSDAMVAKLVGAAIKQFAQLPQKAPPLPAAPTRFPLLATVDPLSGGRKHVKAGEFKTSLIETQLALLEQGSEIVVQSPGGTLIGLYGIASREAGCISISTDTQTSIKSFRHMFRVEKPYLAMRHLTIPLRTRAAETIRIRFAKNAYAVPGAMLDHTMAQVINQDGASVQIGGLVFMLRHDNPPPASRSRLARITMKIRRLFKSAGNPAK
jgi:hypothetical protein